MKTALLGVIRLYWLVVPERKRRECIFRQSCSQHVYQALKSEGMKSGIKAFIFRYRNCRPGCETFIDPHSGSSSTTTVFNKLDMGFRFNKRISLGKGFGLNISKSGISPNLRTRLGSLSPKGFSIRTGIPGLSYRKTGGCVVLLFLYGLLFGILMIVTK